MLIFLLPLPSFELWIPSVSNEQLATFMHKKEDSMNSKYATWTLLFLHKKYNIFMNWARDDLALNHCLLSSLCSIYAQGMRSRNVL